MAEQSVQGCIHSVFWEGRPARRSPPKHAGYKQPNSQTCNKRHTKVYQGNNPSFSAPSAD